MKEFRRWLALAGTVGVASAVLTAVGLPTAPLFGGMGGALLFALSTSSRPLVVPRSLFVLAQAIVGAAVGAMLTHEALRSFAENWAPILAVTLATLVVSVLAGQLLRFNGISPVTAAFASIAGGAAGMIALAHELGSDDRVVAVLQYLRVIIILLALPPVVAVWAGGSPSGAGPPSHDSTSASDHVFVLVVVTFAFVLNRMSRIRIPTVLASMLAAGVLVLVLGFRPGSVPNWMQVLAFGLLGVQVGLGFTKRVLADIAKMMPTALLVIGIVIAACAGLGLALAAWTGETRFDAYLATTPGGLPAVLAAASENSENITFVTSVQVLRIVLILAAAPIIARIFRRRRG